MAQVDLLLNFIDMEKVMTSQYTPLWRHLKNILKTIVHISISIDLQTSYFIPKYNNKRTSIRVKLTLTDAEGHT